MSSSNATWASVYVNNMACPGVCGSSLTTGTFDGTKNEYIYWATKVILRTLFSRIGQPEVLMRVF